MGADAERLPTLHTTAKSDADLVAVWIKSHADSSPHTRRAYERIGRRFVDAFHAAGTRVQWTKAALPRPHHHVADVTLVIAKLSPYSETHGRSPRHHPRR